MKQWHVFLKEAINRFTDNPCHRHPILSGDFTKLAVLLRRKADGQAVCGLVVVGYSGAWHDGFYLLHQRAPRYTTAVHRARSILENLPFREISNGAVLTVTFTTIWRNFFSGKWRAGGDIWKRSRADVRA